MLLVFFGIWVLRHRTFQAKVKGKPTDSVHRSLRISLVDFIMDMVTKLVYFFFLLQFFGMPK